MANFPNIATAALATPGSVMIKQEKRKTTKQNQTLCAVQFVVQSVAKLTQQETFQRQVAADLPGKFPSLRSLVLNTRIIEQWIYPVSLLPSFVRESLPLGKVSQPVFSPGYSYLFFVFFRMGVIGFKSTKRWNIKKYTTNKSQATVTLIPTNNVQSSNLTNQ